MPQVNPDGTVQVSPPLASAFGPASASAPPPAMQVPQNAAPAPGTPGAADAIHALIQALAQHFAPQGLVTRKAGVEQEVDKQTK